MNFNKEFRSIFFKKNNININSYLIPCTIIDWLILTVGQPIYEWVLVCW